MPHPTPSFSINPLTTADLASAIQLIKRCFHEFVAGEYSEQGVEEFERYVDAMPERLGKEHFALLVRAGGDVVGLLEMRNMKHVSLLFVAREYHGRGIARLLWEEGLRCCLETNPGLQEIDVNSSRYAVEVYKRLGFEVRGEYQTVQGIGFVPMVYRVHPVTRA